MAERPSTRQNRSAADPPPAKTGQLPPASMRQEQSDAVRSHDRQVRLERPAAALSAGRSDSAPGTSAGHPRLGDTAGVTSVTPVTRPGQPG